MDLTKAAEAPSATLRSSSALDQFFNTLRSRGAGSILDFGGLTQSNVSYITGNGFRLSTVDFQLSLDSAFGAADPLPAQADHAAGQTFLLDVFGFDDASFDGVLIWDNLEYLTPSVLQAALGQLVRIMKPDGCLLAYFHTECRGNTVPSYAYRIVNGRELSLTLRRLRPLAQIYNTRGLENLFTPFHSVKFFLSREGVREVIAIR